MDFELTKVEIPLDPLSEFDDTNTQVIFDSFDATLSDDDARKLASQYVNYNDVRTRVVR